MTSREGAVYHSSPHVVWVKDAAGTMVLDEARGQSWALDGHRQVIWDALTLGYSFDALLRLLSALLDLPAERVGAFLLDTVREWEGAGIVYREGSPVRG